MNVRVALGLTLAVLLLGALSLRVGTRGRFAVPLSTWSAGPDGAKALYALTAELGHRPSRLTEDFGRVRPTQVLIALGRCDLRAQRELTPVDREALVRFVEAGGSLWMLGPSVVADEVLGVRFGTAERCPEPRSLSELLEAPPIDDDDEPVDDARWISGDAAGNDARLRGIGEIGFAHPAPILIDQAKVGATETLLRDAGGEPLLVRVHRGRGEILALSSSSMLSGERLVHSNGAALYEALLRHFARDRSVVFDEFHLGIGDRRSTIGYLVDLGVAPLLLGLGLALVALVWRTSARLAPARDAGRPEPGGLLETVRGLGTLYARVGDRGLAFEVLQRNALSRIARGHHVEASHDGAATAARLDVAGRTRAGRAVRAIFALAPSPTGEDWRSLEQRLDALVLEAIKDEGEP